MTFGFSTASDFLSWVVVALLGIKVVSTVVLLRRDKDTWFKSRRTAALWWSTKVTPILAVPCMIAIAVQQNRVSDAWGYGALMCFVLLAVPFIVWRRFVRRPNADST
ncbi:hypothetical protein [Sphingopyxis sp. DBS4]|uniref:hypothetical protein n=1 Tax=Sphingopyxis sp. DBS4 TaxID=2968500 RepID=UPI00214AC985|nr:hypothetical protein [Sphingopyxis sp. DBS4]